MWDLWQRTLRLLSILDDKTYSWELEHLSRERPRLLLAATMVLSWNTHPILCSRTVVGLGRALGTPRHDVSKTVPGRLWQTCIFWSCFLGWWNHRQKTHHNFNLSQKCSVFASGIEWNYTRVPAYTPRLWPTQIVHSHNYYPESNSENSEGTLVVTCQMLRHEQIVNSANPSHVWRTHGHIIAAIAL